jgi:hypothetical protein
MALQSNIRVSIQFKESTVFAGEDVECIVTFKNTANQARHHRHTSQTTPRAGGDGYAGGSHGKRKLPPAPLKRPSLNRHNSALSSLPKKNTLKDAAQLSKSSPNTPTRLEATSPTLPPQHQQRQSHGPQSKKGHGRTLSILSLSSEATGVEPGTRRTAGQKRSKAASATSHDMSLETPNGKSQPSRLYSRLLTCK